MIKRVIGYAAVLLLMIYLFFMYDDRVISGMLILTAFYPVVSFLYLMFFRGRLTLNLKRVPPVGETGKEIRAGITVVNLAYGAAVRYEMDVRIGNRYGSGGRRDRIRGTIEAGGEETLWCRFETELCGSTEIRIKEFRIYDPLGIFYIRRKCRERAVVKIMPEFELLPVEITRKIREFQAEAEEYSMERRGDDPSQIYQVREYRPMDSLRDIHWKLSVKEDELMVKERSFPLGCVVLVWIDPGKAEFAAEGFSSMVKKAAALSVTLAEEKCIHMAAWYEEQNERIVKWRVADEESACSMIWHLLEMEPCRDQEKKEACFRDAFRGTPFGAIVTIDGKGRMWKDGEETQFLRL